jgi:hypothetical protein
MKTLKFLIPVLALAGAALAQTAELPRFYKLDFQVKELEGGKPVNSRAFSTMLAASQGANREQATIRAGGRVPVTSSGGTSFFDLGVNIDASPRRTSRCNCRSTSAPSPRRMPAPSLSFARTNGPESCWSLRRNRRSSSLPTTSPPSVSSSSK